MHNVFYRNDYPESPHDPVIPHDRSAISEMPSWQPPQEQLRYELPHEHPYPR